MFDRYLELQKSELENLGGQKMAQEKRHQMEQQRYDALQFFHQSLGQHSPDSQGCTAISFQNRHAMRHHLRTLLDSQEQEVLLARLELDARQKALLSQFGKVKGLTRLQQKRQASEKAKERRQEQIQQDDWLNRVRGHTG